LNELHAAAQMARDYSRNDRRMPLIRASEQRYRTVRSDRLAAFYSGEAFHLIEQMITEMKVRGIAQ
jgi:hypothetical protein